MSEASNPSPGRERSGFEMISPKHLLEREDLSREEKLELLHQWEADLREEMVAEEENMPSSAPMSTTLEEVLDALRSLGAESRFHDVSTKHG